MSIKHFDLFIKIEIVLCLTKTYRISVKVTLIIFVIQLTNIFKELRA